MRRGRRPESYADARADVERMIRSQLADSVKRNTDQTVFVEELTCVRESESRFDCIATVGAIGGEGGIEYVDLSIAATCERGELHLADAVERI